MVLRDMELEGVNWNNLAQDRDRWRVAGCWDYGTEPSGSVKCGNFLGQLRQYLLLEKKALFSVAWLIICRLHSARANTMWCDNTIILS